MLRLVSFNMDYYWAIRHAGPSDVSLALVISARGHSGKDRQVAP